jgi:cobalt-zinc-cadmium efflux system membrane fusion protein
MFVTGHTLDERSSPLVVPRTAVQTLEGESVLFALTEHGFAARPVLLGQEGESLIEIVKGVNAGDEIASTNTFLLKAELAKGEAEHEH